MKYIFLLAFVMLALPLFSQEASDNREQIKKAITYELKLYPEEKLVDLYKSFFQGYWGPGHIITDSTSAINYLTHELANMKNADSLLIHKLGYYNRYVRVNLSLIKEGRISLQEFVNYFLSSANKSKRNSIDEWKTEWMNIVEVIEEMNLHFADYDEDKAKINEMLKQGKYMLHHSEFFENTYFPHYRVLSIEEFERLKQQYNSEQ